MSAIVDRELAELRRAYAELRRANSELRNERDAALAESQARTAELAQRDSDYGEHLKHQSATIDVLKVMSASPGDPQPVFDLIARQAAKTCNVPTAAVATCDGTMLHLSSLFPKEAPPVVSFSMGSLGFLLPFRKLNRNDTEITCMKLTDLK